MPPLDRDTARALTEAGYMSPRDYIAQFGSHLREYLGDTVQQELPAPLADQVARIEAAEAKGP